MVATGAAIAVADVFGEFGPIDQEPVHPLLETRQGVDGLLVQNGHGDHRQQTDERADFEWDRVLVVDDELGVRTFITSVMKSQGWDVLSAIDGMEAQALLQQQHVDVLISDLSMPRLGGFALLDWLVQQAHIPHIVLISGYCPERDAVMQQHGMDVKAWLDKPFTIKTLLEALPLAG